MTFLGKDIDKCLFNPDRTQTTKQWNSCTQMYLGVSEFIGVAYGNMGDPLAAAAPSTAIRAWVMKFTRQLCHVAETLISLTVDRKQEKRKFWRDQGKI